MCCSEARLVIQGESFGDSQITSCPTEVCLGLMQNLDIFLQMRGELIKLGLLKGPKIHLHASLQEQAPQLQRAAMQLGAELMSSPGLLMA